MFFLEFLVIIFEIKSTNSCLACTCGSYDEVFITLKLADL